MRKKSEMDPGMIERFFSVTRLTQLTAHQRSRDKCAQRGESHHISESDMAEQTGKNKSLIERMTLSEECSVWKRLSSETSLYASKNF